MRTTFSRGVDRRSRPAVIKFDVDCNAAISRFPQLYTSGRTTTAQDMDGKNFQREVAFEFDPPLILSQGGEEGLVAEEGRVHHNMEEEILRTLLRRRLLRLQDDGVGGENQV